MLGINATARCGDASLPAAWSAVARPLTVPLSAVAVKSPGKTCTSLPRLRMRVKDWPASLRNRSHHRTSSLRLIQRTNAGSRGHEGPETEPQAEAKGLKAPLPGGRGGQGNEEFPLVRVHLQHAIGGGLHSSDVRPASLGLQREQRTRHAWNCKLSDARPGRDVRLLWPSVHAHCGMLGWCGELQ